MQILTGPLPIALWPVAFAPRLLAILLLALMAAALLPACGSDPPTPTPTASPEKVVPADSAEFRLGVPRFGHEVTLLRNGNVLASGGYTGIANNDFIASEPIGLLQVFSPETGLWSQIEPLVGPGLLYSSVALADGRVMFVGLSQEGNDIGSMASVFDPTVGFWEAVAGPSAARIEPDLVLLNDGRVLAAGGMDIVSESFSSPPASQDVEIFDPATGYWQTAASMTASSADQWLFSLVDGRILSIAAVSNGASDRRGHAEIYDPAADTWTPVDGVEPYYAPSNAVQLSDGRLLVLGSLSEYIGVGMSNGKIVNVELPDGRNLDARQSAELFPDAKVYDPIVDIWTPAGEMSVFRVNTTLTLLPDGRVLAAGGEDPEGYDYVLYSTTEVFDPSTNKWYAGPDLSEPRSRHEAVLLTDGTVLLIGGTGVLERNGERYPLDTHEAVYPANVQPPPVLQPAPVAGLPPRPSLPISCSISVNPPWEVPISASSLDVTPKDILNEAEETANSLDFFHIETKVVDRPRKESIEAPDYRGYSFDVRSPGTVSGCGSVSYPVRSDVNFLISRQASGYFVSKPDTGEWVLSKTMPDLQNALDLLDDHVSDEIAGLTVEGIATVGGASYYRVSGEVQEPVLAATSLIGSAFRGEHGKAKIVYWVEVVSGLVRWVTVESARNGGALGVVDTSIAIEFTPTG